MRKTKGLSITVLLIVTLILSLSLSSCKLNSNSNSNSNSTTSTNNGSDTNNTSSTKQEDAELTVVDFFPLKKDVHMKYKGIGNEYAEYETYVEYIKDNKMQLKNINPGTSLAIVYEIKDGELRKNFSKGEVYYRYDYTDQIDEIEVLIKEPIKKGTSWTLKDGVKRSITEIDKAIKTRAGDYLALEITTEFDGSVTTDYYVKDLGLVKSVFKSKDTEDFTVTSELEKIENDVPYKEIINFFYPDFNKDKLAYIDKQVDLLTNQDMNAIFEKELKNIPTDSELTSSIPGDTKLLDIIIEAPSINSSNELVIVDFSSQFVKEMNAGSSLESMMIGSITNTLGNYYQAQNVRITLEGKPYESGHILLKPGESFQVNMDKTYQFKQKN